MNKIQRITLLLGLAQSLLSGCVSHVYNPGNPENSLHQLRLNQTYGDMVKVLGEPDHSVSEDRTGLETLILFTPWGLVEVFGDFNPSMMQIYSYDKWGKVTVDNNNRIIRVEAR